MIGRDGDVRAAEGPALELQHQAIEEVPPPELGLVELRVDVVVVEDEALAEELEESADEEEEVRRIARVDRVEAAREEHLPAERERLRERGRVLDGVALRPARLDRQVVAMDREI